MVNWWIVRISRNGNIMEVISDVIHKELSCGKDLDGNWFVVVNSQCKELAIIKARKILKIRRLK